LVALVRVVERVDPLALVRREAVAFDRLRAPSSWRFVRRRRGQPSTAPIRSSTSNAVLRDASSMSARFNAGLVVELLFESVGVFAI